MCFLFQIFFGQNFFLDQQFFRTRFFSDHYFFLADIFALSKLPALKMDEGTALIVISVIGYWGVRYLFKLKVDKVVPVTRALKWKSYDW